jgi:hypothetical protein
LDDWLDPLSYRDLFEALWNTLSSLVTMPNRPMTGAAAAGSPERHDSWAIWSLIPTLKI